MDGQGSSDRADRRAQTETLGVVLLLGLAAIGTGMVVMFGSAALDDTRQTSELENAAHVMTLFDSRVAQVALGDSAVQTVSFGQLTGEFAVDPTAGQLTVKHADWDGSGAVETIYDAPLGAVVYRNDDETIVYQGGGVWRQRDGGGATMVSPPEFHYRGATLTLPVIRVTGDDSVGGRADARVMEDSETTLVFPDRSRHYGGDPANPAFGNPADDGTLRVAVQSEYYRAWAEYFRTRTTGEVTVHDGNETTVLELVSKGLTGEFEMPGEGSEVEVRGITEHTVTDYVMTVRSNNPNFANLEWSVFHEDGETAFEMHVDTPSSSGDCGDPVSLTIYYTDGSIDGHHGWYDEDAFAVDCSDGDPQIVMDFVDADGDDPELTYQSVAGETMAVSADGTPPNQANFTGHAAAWEPSNYSVGVDAETVDRILNHYFAEMGEFELTVDDHNRDSVDEGPSGVNLDYDGSGQFFTYLHVTENEIQVELD